MSAVIRRPITTTEDQSTTFIELFFDLATKGDPERAVAYERAWHHSLELRRIHRQLTAGIGVALVA